MCSSLHHRLGVIDQRKALLLEGHANTALDGWRTRADAPHAQPKGAPHRSGTWTASISLGFIQRVYFSNYFQPTCGAARVYGYVDYLSRLYPHKSQHSFSQLPSQQQRRAHSFARTWQEPARTNTCEKKNTNKPILRGNLLVRHHTHAACAFGC